MSKIVEEWRDIKGYEGLYQVSDWGNVKSLEHEYTGRNQYGGVFIGRKKGRVLKQCKDRDGYLIVTLHNNGKQSIGKVHRLVAETFIPNPDNKPVVGHTKTLDDGTEDKTANEVWNLAWMTVEENNTYGTLLERQRISHGGEKCYNFGKHLSEETKNKISLKIKQSVLARNRDNKGRFVTNNRER